jgi:hypothetical protein
MEFVRLFVIQPTSFSIIALRIMNDERSYEQSYAFRLFSFLKGKAILMRSP